MLCETVDRKATAEDVQTLARAAGLELDSDRAGTLAPICHALARADQRLSELPMADSAAAGPPWGRVAHDG